jgi:anti-sigma factor RsiW
MNACKQTIDRIDDYVDGVLDPGAVADVERHLGSCADCRDQAAALRRLIERADALDRAVEPERDLWPSIRSRIVAQNGADRTVRYRNWAWLATAAAAVLAVALLVSLARRPEPASFVAESGSSSASSSEIALAAFERAEVDFERSRAQLLARVEERIDELDPETVRLVRDNLEVMDRAAREIREALDSDPSNTGLRKLLMTSYRKRLDLLRIVGEAPSIPRGEEERT